MGMFGLIPFLNSVIQAQTFEINQVIHFVLGSLA